MILSPPKKSKRSKQEPFTRLLLKQKKSRMIIFNFLTKSDILELSLTKKKIQRMIDLYFKSQLRAINDSSFEGVLNQMILKAKKKPKNNIFKTTIFDIDYSKLIEPHTWMLLNPTEELNKSVLADLSFLIPPKLVKDYKRYIFYAPEIKKYIVINRTLSDERQQVFYKISKREENRNSLEEMEPEKKDMIELTQSKEFALENFMGSENGMMIRQRLLCEKLEEMKKEREKSKVDSEKNGLKFSLTSSKICIVLCAGGYFSLIVYKDFKEILHKSDHRYVIRKKQGGRQMVKDKSKNVMASVGSQMRRLNEINHQKKIFEILNENRNYLEEADFIVVHAPGENKAILFDEGRALYDFRSERRVRYLNIEVKRANYSEAKRAYEELLKVYIVAEDNFF